MSQAIKLLVNGIAGSGKTSLLSSMGEETFVISRDAKKFGLPIPHYLVENWVNMEAFLYGYKDEEDNHIEGVFDKIEKYNEKFGHYPENIVIDSVSQIFMDVIEEASKRPNVYGSQGAEVTKEMGILTKFIHEDLEMNGMNVILLNHVIEEKVEGKPTGKYESFGSGKFLSKGGFFSTTNESVTLVLEGNYRAVWLRGQKKQARTTLTDIPDKMYVEDMINPDKSKKLKKGEEYFTLRGHMDKLLASQKQVDSWSL